MKSLEIDHKRDKARPRTMTAVVQLLRPQTGNFDERLFMEVAGQSFTAALMPAQPNLFLSF